MEPLGQFGNLTWVDSRTDLSASKASLVSLLRTSPLTPPPSGEGNDSLMVSARRIQGMNWLIRCRRFSSVASSFATLTTLKPIEERYSALAWSTARRCEHE